VLAKRRLLVGLGLGLIVGLCLLAWFDLNTAPSHAGRDSDAIQAILAEQHENGQFDGSILVARDGVIIYRGAFGKGAGALFANKPDTPSNLASVSKQFTAMAIMMLVERDKLSYDDPVARHLPALDGATSGMTIRHLLTHTSGIPDVGDLGIDHPDLKEDEVLKAVREQHAKFAPPGEKYRYSNTGYMIVAMIVEKVTRTPLSDFLDDRIFRPLRMEHTYLKTRPGYTKGDGGIVSTVDDLLKWDQALYTEKLVRQATLDEAFTPGRVRQGTSTYGFGWNVADKEGDRFVWHTGNTGQFRAFIGRRLGEKLLVAILTNNGNSRRMEIHDAIVNIVRGKPFVAPKLSIAARIAGRVESEGIEAGLREYQRLKLTEPEKFDFSETELNSLGYQLLGRNQNDFAIRIFELNTNAFPASSNAYDSLGEAYQRAGKRPQAVQAYRKALELDPNNLNSQRMLQALQ
jgi:CubicO group peptidase (beta-lactamase class C family)